MTKETLEEKVLERIKGAHPRSRRYFLLRDVGMWLLAAMSVILGALAVSSLIFRTINLPPAHGPDRPHAADVLAALPLIWIIATGIFGYLAYQRIRATKRGYRYEFSTLMLSMVLASVVLGGLLFMTGAGLALDRLSDGYVPFQPSLERVQSGRWQRPEEGFLVGMVEKKSGDSTLTLIDPNKTAWTVDLAPSIPEERITSLTAGERVGMRGKVTNAAAHIFHACEIRSLEFQGRGQQRQIPPPLFAGRNASSTRSIGCEDVRPPVTH